MKLKAILENLDELPESIDPRELFVEKDGKFELAIEGAKSQADVDRLSKALAKERNDHRGTKERIKAFGDLTPESLLELQDEVETLRAAPGSKGRPTDESVQKLVGIAVEKEKRAFDKRVKDLEAENTTLKGENVTLVGEKKRRVLVDTIREVTAGDKGIPIRIEALQDVELFAERVFEFGEDGKPVTREGVGVEAGLSPRELLTAIQVDGKRPHWFKETIGAGATGGSKGGKSGGPNPFDKKTFNITDASALMKTDPVRAKRLINSAEDATMARTVFASYLK